MSMWFLTCSLNHGIQVGVGINFLWRRNHWSQTRPLIVIEQKKVITNSKQELKNRDPRSKDLPSRVSWGFEICIYTRCCKAFHAVVISGLVFQFLLLCRGCVKYEFPKTTAWEAGCCLPIKEKVKNVFHDSVFCSVPPTCLKSENWQREAGKNVKWCILLCDKYPLVQSVWDPDPCRRSIFSVWFRCLCDLIWISRTRTLDFRWILA